jgi:hypothetical protein
MSDENQLLAGARLGIDAESFSRSEFGRWLKSKAADEIQAATSELVDTDPDDVKANRDLRNQIHVAKMFLTWLDEAINVGRHCVQEIEEIDSLTNHQGD